MTFPFSLIAEPRDAVAGVPPAFNELFPAWGLYKNAYGMARFENKFAKRDKARRGRFPYAVLRPDIVRLVLRALGQLEQLGAVGIKAVYTERDCAGIGKNFLREDSRLQAIGAYRDFLRRYALRAWLARSEGGAAPSPAALLAGVPEGSAPALRQFLEECLDVARRNAEAIRTCKLQDDIRGAQVFEG